MIRVSVIERRLIRIYTNTQTPQVEEDKDSVQTVKSAARGSSTLSPL